MYCLPDSAPRFVLVLLFSCTSFRSPVGSHDIEFYYHRVYTKYSKFKFSGDSRHSPLEGSSNSFATTHHPPPPPISSNTMSIEPPSKKPRTATEKEMTFPFEKSPLRTRRAS